MPGGRIEDYCVIEDIGSGSFGICQKIKKKLDGKVLAWKVIEYGGMSESEKLQLVKEVNVLRELRHQHIVRYQDRIIDRTNSRLYIVMEYCSGGDMAKLIAKMKRERKYLEEEFIWRVMYQLALALEECHSKRDTSDGGKVLHRDIKPANVFLDSNGDVKLGDFGVARILHDTSLAKTIVGTPYYMSPEQYRCSSYDQMSDMWSLGCLMYELCALSPPFMALNKKDLMIKVCHGVFARIPSKYSDELQSTIASLLHIKPEKRPIVSTIVSTARAHVHSLAAANGVAPTKTAGAILETKQCELAIERLKLKEQTLVEREKLLYCREKELKRREKAIEKKEQQLKLREKQLYTIPIEDGNNIIKINQPRVRLPSKRKENISD